MIFHGRINRCEKIVLDDGGVLFECRMSDSSKPFNLRTDGEFLTYLNEKKRKLLPSGDAVYDSEITIIARSMAAGKGGAVKIKGDIQAGIIPLEVLSGSTAGELPTKPQGPKG